MALTQLQIDTLQTAIDTQAAATLTERVTPVREALATFLALSGDVAADFATFLGTVAADITANETVPAVADMVADLPASFLAAAKAALETAIADDADTIVVGKKTDIAMTS